jgi:hypothetical protein
MTFFLLQDKRDITSQRASRTHVEDEVLVGVLEGEPAAELDTPDQHHDRRDDGQHVRHVRERRRPHAQPHGPLAVSLSSLSFSLAGADRCGCLRRRNDRMSGRESTSVGGLGRVTKTVFQKIVENRWNRIGLNFKFIKFTVYCFKISEKDKNQ